MLHIHHAEDDAQHPSKTYADACWAANLSLSPDWWREAHGYTIGKLALDWRTAITQPEHLATGCNLILVSPETWPQASALIAAQPLPEAFMVVLVTTSPQTLPTHVPSWVLWQIGATTPEERQQNLVILEEKVKSGQLEAYGLSLQGSMLHPLHMWLEDAATAANTVWNRRKRPALRLLNHPLDLTNLTLLTEVSTQHKTQPVSTLELAARLSLTVIAIAQALPLEQTPSPQAMAALTKVAEAENTLNQHLGGWPTIAGQPLFNVLTHLIQGQTPWPTMSYWQAWQTHVWPELQHQWAQLQTAANAPYVQTYLKNMAELLPHGPELAVTASSAVAENLIRTLTPRFPTIWQTTSPEIQTYALLSSIPGVTALALSQPFNPQPLHQRPNVADVGAILLEKPNH